MRSAVFTTKPSRRETLWGGIYLVLYMTVLPLAVPLVVMALFPGLDAARINFVYFTLNFAATAVIFRKYLIQSVRDAFLAGLPTVKYALLGYLGSIMLTGMMVSAILEMYPEFMSVNDNAIHTMVDQNRTLMFLGAVVLAPVTEELLFRGLIFRGLYDRSPLAAHLVSMGLFSLIHVSGYVGMYDAKLLFFCFLQYLPAAYCLNFTYQQSGTILSPILMHMATNLVAMLATR
jgi:membrane protease YdiL (CAAX protease family)